MSSDPRRWSNRNSTNRQERDLAGTVVQDLWHRCHPLSCLSERKDVHNSAAASLSMPQPLVIEMNPMNKTTINSPTSCENHFLFRYAPLLPKIAHPRSFRPSIDRFVTIWAPVTTPYPYQTANKAPDPPPCP